MPKPDALLCVLCGEWRERESASFDTTVQEKGREEGGNGKYITVAGGDFLRRCN